MALLDPLAGVLVALIFLVLLLYRRVNLGITLNAAAIVLAVISLDWKVIPEVAYETFSDHLTISVVLATFGVMLLSQLYKETKTINRLSESLSRILRSPKIITSLLPAVIGLLPVAGGAVMSAPLVEAQAEKLGLKPERKAYLNLWFRHTIFPVYPLSQVLIITAALTYTTVPSIILRQIPVVVVMIIVGYTVGFWRTSRQPTNEERDRRNESSSNLKEFALSFSPILVTIFVAVGLEVAGLGSSQQGYDVLVATFIGILVLFAISKPNLKVAVKPLKGWGIYGITASAFGAFLLRNVMEASGISNIFSALAGNGNVDTILILTLVPAFLSMLMGSPLGGVALSISILAGTLEFSPKIAALVYMSAYLGYVISPTHLCFTFTADYFRCSLGRIYKYILPSVLATFATALFMYIAF